MTRLKQVAAGLTMVALLLPVLAGCGGDVTPTPLATSPAATPPAATTDNTATPLPTELTGAATMVATAVGTMSPADADYLTKVQALATKLQNSPEIANAVTAVTNAATTAASGGTVDTAPVVDAINKALAVVNDVSNQAAALQPPPELQSVQGELTKTTGSYQSALNSALTAVNSGNWGDVTQAVAALGQAAVDLSTLVTDLASRGVR